jgi:hypothetical protein
MSLAYIYFIHLVSEEYPLKYSKSKVILTSSKPPLGLTVVRVARIFERESSYC